jgi:hypothetical protein
VSYTYEGKYRLDQKVDGYDGILRDLKTSVEAIIKTPLLLGCTSSDAQTCANWVIYFIDI